MSTVITYQWALQLDFFTGNIVLVRMRNKTTTTSGGSGPYLSLGFALLGP